MNYLLKNKNENPIKKKIIIIFFIFILFFLLNYFFSGFFFSFFNTISKPFFTERGVFQESSGFFGYFKNKSHLIDENNKLKKEIENLKLQKIELEAIKNDFINIKPFKDANRIIASVISKPPFSPFDVILLDKGSSDLVFVGNDIFIGSSTYLGKVSFLSANSSEVTLFSSSGQEREVYIQRTNTNIKLYGQGSLNFRAVVPKDLDVEEGDILIDKSFDSSIVAKVYKIDATLQGSFKTVYAKMPMSFRDIFFVEIRN